MIPDRSHRLLLCCAIAFGFFAVFPSVLHTLHHSYRGLTVIRDKDYGNYFSRLQRTLSGHGEEADNGITPIGAGIDGAQVAGTERAVGFLFSWAGLPAPTLAVVLAPFFVSVLFLFFYSLFRLLEFNPHWSLGMASVYFFILFHVVSRVVHPGWSFIPALAALVSFFLFWKKFSLPLALLAGLLLGVLPYLYFWHWTYVWSVAGSAVVLSLVLWMLENNPPFFMVRFPLLILIVTTLLVSLPFLLQLMQLMQHPLYEQVALRGGFLTTRAAESMPRSLLLALQTGFFLSLFRTKKREWSYLAVLSFLLGILIAMHQNIVHGRLLMFSSHFYPHLVLSSLVAGAWVIVKGAPLLQRTVVAGIALLFLAGAAYDYLPGYRFFVPRESDFRDQHLLEPIRILRNNGTSDVVLTDAHTGRVLTSFSEEGIVYTTHTRFLLISDAEMAERYCLSELFSPTPPEAYRALYMEYNAVLDSPAMREHEHTLVQDACERVRINPLSSLRTYGVTHVLWNQVLKPDWNILLYPLPLQVIASSDEWLLLSLRP